MVRDRRKISTEQREETGVGNWLKSFSPLGHLGNGQSDFSSLIEKEKQITEMHNKTLESTRHQDEIQKRQMPCWRTSNLNIELKVLIELHA
jgi:hypothetical protein